MTVFINQNIGNRLTPESRILVEMELAKLREQRESFHKNPEKVYASNRELFGSNCEGMDDTCFDHDEFFIERTLETGIIQMGEILEELPGYGVNSKGEPYIGEVCIS